MSFPAWSICCRYSFGFGPGRAPRAGSLHAGAIVFDNQASLKFCSAMSSLFLCTA